MQLVSIFPYTAPNLPNSAPGDVFDHQGHSTHVCGTVGADGKIKGVVPSEILSLYPAKVLGDTGRGNDDAITAGLRWAIEKGVDGS